MMEHLDLLPRTVFVILFFIVFSTMNVYTNNFKIATYNCHGLKSSLQYVLELAESHDILFLNEHWLQVHELFTIEQICEDNNLKGFFRSSVNPTNTLHGRPHGGLGFVCKNSASIVYKIIDCNNDRIYGIQILKNQNVIMCVFGVYLPHFESGPEQFDAYMDTLNQLQCLIDDHSTASPVTIMGDFNTVLPKCNPTTMSGKWFCRKPFTKWSAILYEFLEQNEMIVVDFLFEQSVNYTYSRGDKRSYIDHIIMPMYQEGYVNSCNILHNAKDNASDHFAISCRVNIPGDNSGGAPIDDTDKEECISVPSYPKARWSDPEFQFAYSEAVMTNMNRIHVINPVNVDMTDIENTINTLYEDICTAMHDSVMSCISNKNSTSAVKCTKPWWNRKCTLSRNRNRFSIIFGNHVVARQVEQYMIVIKHQEKPTERAAAQPYVVKE